jgi:hypothetical protein
MNCGYDHAIAVKSQNESIATLSDAISSLHLCSHRGFSKGGMVRLIFADGRTAHSRSTVTGPHGQDSKIMGLWTDKYPEAKDV